MGKTKRVAGADEPVDGAEAALEPAVVQRPPPAEPVEVPHVAIAIRTLPDL